MEDSKIMFSSKSIALLIASAVLIIISLTCMAIDPEPSGFGILTLWIAPPLLLLGFTLPAVAIAGLENIPKVNGAFTVKRIVGMLAFFIAFLTYILTLEPTASLWDCSEFIASSYKLQVPHTPGTPLSLLIGRIFSMLAPDVQQVARMVNLMSAFFSALSVMLVYHIIYYFGAKMIALQARRQETMLILASLCGSLCLTFSDTFWFSAVEAETYGAACFFLLLIIWMMLRGLDTNEPLRNRMLILISYVSGLAYCVHPMCLLVLPILPLVWFAKDRNVTIKTSVLAVFSGLVLVFIINRFVAIGIFDLAFLFDRIAVNSLGLPFYSGVIILLFAATGSFYLILKKLPQYQAYTWAVIFLILGFTPYLMLFIRSNQNPPIDETNPEDLYQIKAYMNRESYGSSPLLFGPYYDAQIKDVAVASKAYYKDKEQYKVAGNRIEYAYEKSRETILPRMYSRDPNHIQAYQQWLGLEANEKPSFSDNLKFMFTYQLGHMYMRYLLWNFAGRESDVQDSAWLRPWDRLSNGSSERARNQFWMVPLLLGILGAWAQFHRDRKGFVTNSIFFLFTGVALALYLNSPPAEPRERDYIYVGSYIAYSLWIGLGIVAIGQHIHHAGIKFFLLVVITLSLPLWMLYQNYDDHDRSGRTFQVDYARTVLNNCAPHSILFTGGDNDTFPLWYLQEVEGFRTDVRVVVLSYFNTDWYINQLRRSYYESPPFQLSLTVQHYRQYGPNDVLYLDDKIKQGIDVQHYLQLIKEEHSALRAMGSDGDFYHILPSRKLTIRRDSAELNFAVNGNYLEKNALAILDLMISNDWKRPLYFNFTSMNTLSMDIKPYLVQEGLVFRLTSARSDNGPVVNTELTYKNLIDTGDFSNLADAQVNFNFEDYYTRMIVPLRQSFNSLAEACLQEGNTVMAEKVLTTSVEKLHHAHISPSFTDLYTANMLISLGKVDLAKSLTMPAFNFYYDHVASRIQQNQTPDNFDVYILRQSTALLHDLGETSYADKFRRLGLE